MKILDYTPGMPVLDRLPSLGHGVVTKVYKHTVHVRFAYKIYDVVYDEEHLQFLEKAQ